jgi:predicted aspartyl protease
MAIQGTVTTARQPVVVLETFPKKRKISVIIDTGFSGELCLSPRIIHRMGFERVGRERMFWRTDRLSTLTFIKRNSSGSITGGPLK